MLKIAIVGRPNVGKSTLFNRLCAQRAAIIHAQEGMTRDRKYREIKLNGTPVGLFDTGGLTVAANDSMAVKIARQVMAAIEETQLIILVMDVRQVTVQDKDILRMLRRSNKPFITAVNKVDSHNQEGLLADFYNLGVNSIVGVSALHNRNISLLIESILRFHSQHAQPPAVPDPLARVCVIGRPNVGKSTFINTLLNKERLIVDDTPGTTRDAIDTLVQYYGEHYLFIDTAGLRRKRRVTSELEGLSIQATLRSIRRSDICFLLIDGQQGLTGQEQKILDAVAGQEKALIMGINKWDLVVKQANSFETLKRDIYRRTHHWGLFPIFSLSAKTRLRATNVFQHIHALGQRLQQRIQTARLNQFFQQLTAAHSPGMFRKKDIKIYYAAQVGINPHVIICWLNFPEVVPSSYKRYIVNRVRKEYGLHGIYIKVVFKKRV